jgi:hypothetical protein
MLTNLDISGNAFDSLGALPLGLQYLRAGRNRLSSLGPWFQNASFLTQSSLLFIDLSQNPLGLNHPDNNMDFLWRRQVCDWAAGYFSVYANADANLPNLVVFNCADCAFAQDISLVLDLFAGLQRLTQLQLSGNGITGRLYDYYWLWIKIIGDCGNGDGNTYTEQVESSFQVKFCFLRGSSIITLHIK